MINLSYVYIGEESMRRARVFTKDNWWLHVLETGMSRRKKTRWSSRGAIITGRVRHQEHSTLKSPMSCKKASRRSLRTWNQNQNKRKQQQNPDRRWGNPKIGAETRKNGKQKPCPPPPKEKKRKNPSQTETTKPFVFLRPIYTF